MEGQSLDSRETNADKVCRTESQRGERYPERGTRVRQSIPSAGKVKVKVTSHFLLRVFMREEEKPAEALT